MLFLPLIFTLLFASLLVEAVPITNGPVIRAKYNDETNVTYLEVADVSAYEDLMARNKNVTTISAAAGNDDAVVAAAVEDDSVVVHIAATGEYCSKNKNIKRQYCVKSMSDPYTYQDPIGAPLTACLDSRYGEGGSTSKSFSIGISIIPGFTVALSDTTVTMITLTGGVTVTKSLSISLTNSCDVTTGNIVQMWGYPFYTVCNIKYRSFKISKHRGKKKDWSDWSDSKEVVFATNTGPATRCIGSVNEAICGQHPVKNKFVVPGKPLIDDMGY